MEALKNITSNVPDWLKRLDELSGQIEQRQFELAQVTEPQTNGASSGRVRSIRNRGSTESLKPKDDTEAHPGGDPGGDPQPPASPAQSNTPSATQRQTNLVRAAGQARARAAIRKRQRAGSMASAEGAPPKYRTRSMIIVYYDSYVQSFFEELVKFVSASRNMMRKAKMAARVAQIRRMADLEMSEERDEEGGTGGNPATATIGAPRLIAAIGAGEAGMKLPDDYTSDGPIEASSDGTQEDIPALRYISTRRMQPISRRPNMMMASPLQSSRTPRTHRGIGPAAAHEEPKGNSRDLYDELDKGLERVQGLCEHAAHQFLRDGDCADEVSKIQKWLAETRELADRETERATRDDPAMLSSPQEPPVRGRSYRPPNMRRGHVPSAAKDTAAANDAVAAKIEVDEAIHDMDG